MEQFIDNSATNEMKQKTPHQAFYKNPMIIIGIILIIVLFMFFMNKECFISNFPTENNLFYKLRNNRLSGDNNCQEPHYN